MLSVTVTKHGTNGLKIQASSPTGPTIRTRYASSSDPGAAAAEALSIAQQHGIGGYVIVGPSDVMSCIPESVRSKS